MLAGARAEVACRSRYAEDVLAASGAGQYVILGAGLDSFACRSPLAAAAARQRDTVDAALWRRSDALRPRRLSVLTHAAVPPRAGLTPAPGWSGTP